jgi:glyoxylase-like metal-dependent hydrolase (beta-lactamase superfamily II)
MEIAPRIRRVGGDSIVNAYLVEDGGEVTIVDAGLSGLWSALPAELAAMGRRLEDVRSIVLTHGHSDHIGFAERARSERGWPVRVHELDAALARGEVPNPAKGGAVRPLPLLGFLWWSVRHGARVRHLGAVETYGDGATLDVPGSPRVTLVPGHTPGSATLHFAGHDALLVGDALCTYAVTTGRRGPRIAPFSADPEVARASLARLEGVAARWVLPGHGDAFGGGVDEAIRLAREAPLP